MRTARAVPGQDRRARFGVEHPFGPQGVQLHFIVTLNRVQGPLRPTGCRSEGSMDPGPSPG